MCISTLSFAQTKDNDSVKYRRMNSHYPLFTAENVQSEDFKELYPTNVHPHLIEALSEIEKVDLLKQVNARRRSLNRDTLFASDLLYIWMPYTERLMFEDPHHQTIPGANTQDDKYKINNVKTLGLSHLRINDTVLVDQMIDPQFVKGDMILAINDVPIETYMKYTHSKFRYDLTMRFCYNYNFCFTPEYKVDVIRNGKPMTIISKGEGLVSSQFELNDLNSHHIKMYENEKCGYIEIPEFYPINTRLIKILSKNIKKFKQNGCTNVILDLRKNTGGYGGDFDKLMSIFINKPTVKYLKSSKIKVSEHTVGFYDFITEDMMGKVVDLPDGEFVREFEIHPKMFIEGIKYYVMISQNTGSIAASFVNILQFNDAATLVGEPLMHNALNYGEVVGPIRVMPTLKSFGGIFSTVMLDEHTNAVDGVVMPDIAIPYVAKEYMTGNDAMLEKLLVIIKK